MMGTMIDSGCRRRYRTTRSGKLFFCFFSSSSSSMNISSRSILSPARHHPLSLSASLSRRLRSDGSLKGGQSPMFPTNTASKKRTSGALENPEPSSPKVTCIGQVRVKSKKKKNSNKHGRKLRNPSRRRSGGDGSFRRTDNWGSLDLSSSQTNILPENRHRNQRWVHLPLTICEGLKGLGAEISCLLPCRSSSCFSSSSERGSKRERSIRSNLEEIEISREKLEANKLDTSDVEEEEEEEERLSVCVPPKNALLLMRCRSDPMRMAALSRRLLESPLPNGDEPEGNNVEEDADFEETEPEPERCSSQANAYLITPGEEGNEHLEVEEGEEHFDEDSSGMDEEESEQRKEEPPLEEEDSQRGSTMEEEEEDILRGSTMEEEEEEEEDILRGSTMEEEEEEEEDILRGSTMKEEEEEEYILRGSTMKEEEEEDILRGSTMKEEEEDIPRGSTMEEEEDILSGSTMEEEEEDEVDAGSLSASGNEDDQKFIEEENKEEERESAASVRSDDLAMESRKEMESVEEDKATNESEEEVENEEEEEEEEEEERGGLWQEDDQAAPEPLPDCLLLMMCEPKVSMEVSKETWVCSTDFMRFLPERRRPVDESEKKVVDIRNTNPSERPNKAELKQAQPPRSSCSIPGKAAPVLSTVQKLPRCKSEPMRTAAAKLVPSSETCMWKSRKVEPLRRATVGVMGSATGVGF